MEIVCTDGGYYVQADFRFSLEDFNSAIEDKALVRRLAHEGIALEISPTSNLLLKAVPSLEAHPVRQLFDMGVPIVINKDDPAFFDTTLCRGYQLFIDHLGFSEKEIDTLIDNAFDYSFLPPAKMRALLK